MSALGFLRHLDGHTLGHVGPIFDGVVGFGLLGDLVAVRCLADDLEAVLLQLRLVLTLALLRRLHLRRRGFVGRVLVGGRLARGLLARRLLGRRLESTVYIAGLNGRRGNFCPLCRNETTFQARWRKSCLLI